MDAYAEELAFLTIYMGVPRKIIGPRSTPFAIASSEIRRTDRRGATPEHVLYMAAKVMRYNVAESNMTFRTSETTGSITREQLERGGKKFLEEELGDLSYRVKGAFAIAESLPPRCSTRRHPLLLSTAAAVRER
ncbi:hypothetical protein MRX96_058119 [Rhipicephalus microplus]